MRTIPASIRNAIQVAHPTRKHWLEDRTMTLRDHQPDILFQGDELARQEHELLASIGHGDREIRRVLQAAKLNGYDRARRLQDAHWCREMRRHMATCRENLAKVRAAIAERDGLLRISKMFESAE